MTKTKEKIGGSIFLILAIVSFVSILSGNISYLFLPLYKKIYYGAATMYFLNLGKTVIWVAEILLITRYCHKKLGYFILTEKGVARTELPKKRIAVITLLTLAPVFYISSQIGWQVKLFYDFGEKLSGYESMGHIAEIFADILQVYLVTMLIKFSGEYFDSKYSGNVPLSGVFLCATFGVYQLIAGVHYLPITYLLLNILFGIYYCLTDKNFEKTYLLILAVYTL